MSDRERYSALQLHPSDNVAVAREQLVDGMLIGRGVLARGLIPAGHKVALHAMQPGQFIRRYGQIIGSATREIREGEHVHTHNLASTAVEQDYAFGSDVVLPPIGAEQETFRGFLRSDGRAATRNYIGVLTTVNCSATAARAIADRFRRDIFPQELEPFPNVDGVVALTHNLGCAMNAAGEELALLRRTIGGYARHPNFAAILIVGLGCETNQAHELLADQSLVQSARIEVMNIQSSGGTTKSVAEGVERIRDLLPRANCLARRSIDVRHLIVGLQCGGSDGYSGITANPALGLAVDRLVANGATAILSETPEIYGAEHLLTRRAISRVVGEALLSRVKWWEEYCARMNVKMDNNPSFGNKAGGLTTILEKSLGAIAKAGTSPLMDVYRYAEPVCSRGLVFMDTPGYDPVSATGQVAGGANLLCFTTGRGSAYGCAPAPSIKISSNTPLWSRQTDDIDLNCGGVLDGTQSLEEAGEAIFRSIIETASGKPTKSELHGYGQNEFAPWPLGATM